MVLKNSGYVNECETSFMIWWSLVPYSERVIYLEALFALIFYDHDLLDLSYSKI